MANLVIDVSLASARSTPGNTISRLAASRDVHNLQIATHPGIALNHSPTQPISSTDTASAPTLYVVTSLCTRPGDTIQQYEFYDNQEIASGAYGIVYLGRCIKTHRHVAIKSVLLSNADIPEDQKQAQEQEQVDDGMDYTVVREMAILRDTYHPNIVPLEAVAFLPNDCTTMYYVFPYYPMNLADIIRNSRKLRAPLKDKQVRQIAHDLLSGIRYLHAKRVVHRDLKPQNLLMDANGRMVIADMGLARQLRFDTAGYTPDCMTFWYRPPEVFLGSYVYTHASDMWSIGCILMEIMLGHPIWGADSEDNQLQLIFQTLGTPSDAIWPEVSSLPHYPHNSYPYMQAVPFYARLRKVTPELVSEHGLLLDLVSHLLVYNPEARWSASQALKHSYFE